MWRDRDLGRALFVALGTICAAVGIAGLLLCGPRPAKAADKDPVRFRQHLPAYVATDYSTSKDWKKEDTPYLKAQASMAMTVLRNPIKIGPVTMDPELAFTWRANNWPVGAESSPINENIYMPEAFVRFNEDESGWWRGARAGWWHNSSGTDSASASIDRVLLESKFAYDSIILGDKFFYLTGYVRGWYVLGTGSGTDNLRHYINFSRWQDVGGELMVSAEIEGVIRGVVELGLSYQHYEVYIPLAEAYDIDLFGQVHHGNANGINNYEDRATSGGVGLALVR